MFDVSLTSMIQNHARLALIATVMLLPAAGCGGDDGNSGSTDTSNGTTAASNNTTGTSNGTTGTSNGTTAISNGTTGTSNGTTATSNGTTDIEQCQAVCEVLAACEEIVGACGAQVAAGIGMACQDQFCTDPNARPLVLALDGVPCETAVPLALDQLPEELTDMCGGNGEPGVTQCGGFVPRNDLAEPEQCATCMDEACCDEAMACGDDPECLALRQCFAGCEFDSDCLNACNDTVTEEVSAINSPLIMCRNTSCGNACARASNWTCVGAPERPTRAPGTASLTITVNDFQSGAPVPDATIKICALDDIMCEAPIAEGTSGADGSYAAGEIPVAESGFEGYFEITGGGRFPTLLYIMTPLVDDALTLSASIISQSIFEAFSNILGITLDPERAHAAVVVFDCSTVQAGGVVFGADNADAQTEDGYIAGSLPSPDATTTDGSGVGGVFNLPPGQTTVFGDRAEDSVRLFEQDVILRAGFLTNFSAIPNR